MKQKLAANKPAYLRFFPLLGDIKQAERAGLSQDLLAGMITAILLIPQALAYSLLAGLPPEVGLYASVLPPIIYAFTGTSRTLAVGPVAVAAVMVAAALVPYAAGDPDKYLSGALILSALTGLIMLAMGFLRLGWLTHFISHPVLTGFTTGAAIFIVGTQLAALMGISVPKGVSFAVLLQVLVDNIHTYNLAAAIFGGVAVVLLILARQPLAIGLTKMGMAQQSAMILGRTAPLFVVVAAILLAWWLDAASRFGIAVVGLVPQGLPLPSFDFMKAEGWAELLPAATMIAVIAYVESISVAKILAFRRRQRIDPDQEFRALGLANVAAACAGTMPVAGGFSRSMVNFDAGARTQLAAIVTASLVALAAFLFTGLLENLPKAVLSAIIVVAVWQLIDIKGLKHTWCYDKGDGFAQGATLLGVLAFGIEHGLMLGVGLALILFLYRTSRPHIAVVGRIAGTEHYRNIHRHRVQTWPQLLLVRIDENIYFANTPRVETELHNLVLDDAITDVVLIFSGVAYVDSSGLEMLESIEEELSSSKVRLHLAEVKGPVLDRLCGTKLYESLGGERIYLSTEKAVEQLVPATTI
ncbi:sodium-independent anion transporter [Gammaproteobacteria bacterium 53_120_T64]|nr:sodium-independent anion transporter [Gammaproteobacteria bacterium 53_120_T64]